MEGWLGMLGTGRWDDISEHRPQNWRQKILQLFPNGTSPFTAMMSMMPSEKTDDAHFNWFEKDVPTLSGTVTGLYKNTGLSTAYTLATNYAAGATVYVKMSEADASQFIPNIEVVLAAGDDLSKDLVGKIVDVAKNGASSYVAVKLLQADVSKLANGTTDTIVAIGEMNPEGAEAPDSVTYESERKYNYTQIFWTTLMMTRTASQTRFRTGDKYLQAKKECLAIHGAMQERAALFSVLKEWTGSNGQKERATHGLMNWIRDYDSGSQFLDFKRSSETGVTGKTWKAVGEDYLDDKLEILSRYGDPNNKFGLCGNGVVVGLTKLAKQSGNYQLTEETKSYGIQVWKWTAPTCIVYLHTHPQFNMISRYRNLLVMFEPRFCKARVMQDTVYKSDPNRRSNSNGGYSAIDGYKEGYLTEIGYEFHHPKSAMVINGVGLDNIN